MWFSEAGLSSLLFKQSHSAGRGHNDESFNLWESLELWGPMWTHWARGHRVCIESSIPITWRRSAPPPPNHSLFCLSNFSRIFMQLSRTIIPTWTRIFQVRPLWELRVKPSCPSYGQGQAHSFTPADKAASCEENISSTLSRKLCSQRNTEYQRPSSNPGTSAGVASLPHALLSRVSGLWTGLFLHSRAQARCAGNNTDPCWTPNCPPSESEKHKSDIRLVIAMCWDAYPKGLFIVDAADVLSKQILVTLLCMITYLSGINMQHSDFKAKVQTYRFKLLGWLIVRRPHDTFEPEEMLYCELRLEISVINLLSPKLTHSPH